MKFPTFKLEKENLDKFDYILGCDEVGRGCIAGPVVAAWCLLDSNKVVGYRSAGKWFYRVRDSKTINEEEREKLCPVIKENSLAWAIAEVDPQKIDEINIHYASLLSMKLALKKILEKIKPKENSKILLVVDGKYKIKDLEVPTSYHIEQNAIVDADEKILSVAAASIIAKVYRDALMKEFDNVYPGYQFSKHKGYNTKAHQEAVQKKGITPLHRKSFLKEFVNA